LTATLLNALEQRDRRRLAFQVICEAGVRPTPDGHFERLPQAA